MKVCFIFLSVIIVGIAGCSKSNEVAESGHNTGGNNGCDTANMKYVADVESIIKANCYGCHGNNQSFGGVNLGSYTTVKQHADNGSLIGAITHAAGYSPMPKGAAKLSDCDINKIKAWIASGAKNN